MRKILIIVLIALVCVSAGITLLDQPRVERLQFSANLFSGTEQYENFNRINEILARLVDKVQTELAEIWPPLKILDYTAAKTDEAIVNFAMGRARDHAWGVAERLAPLTPQEQEPVITEVDANSLVVGRAVRRPGLLIGAVLALVRLGELGTVQRKIEALEGIS